MFIVDKEGVVQCDYISPHLAHLARKNSMGGEVSTCIHCNVHSRQGRCGAV